MKRGWLFLPAHWFAWTLLLICCGLSLFVFVSVDSRSHSASDTLKNWMAWNVVLLASYQLIGFLTRVR